MDRVQAYVGSEIYEWYFSKQAQNDMVGLAKLSALVLGTSTLVNGLACSPTSPASMQVVIGQGEIYQLESLEATVCGTLPADTTDQILKQGILLGSTNLPASSTFAAPVTSSQSINYLIEAQYADSDVSIDPTTGVSPVTLNYYNSANPATPWSGPNNSGASSNTFRKGIVALQVKAGAAATSGTQLTPAPDAGYVGIAVVTVAYGATSLTAANIQAYPGAPILPTNLVSAIQNSSLTVGVDTGAANACVVNYNLPIPALKDGMVLWFAAAVANTGATTLNVNGLGAKSIVGLNQTGLQGGEIIAGGKCGVIWSATLTSWVLFACSGGALQVANAVAPQQATSASQVQAGSLTSGSADTGTANAYKVQLTPLVLALSDNQIIWFQPANTNTGASTFSPNGGGNSYPILGGALQPLQGGEIAAGAKVGLMWKASINSFIIIAQGGGARQIPNAQQTLQAVALGQLLDLIGGGAVTYRNKLINASGVVNQRNYTSGTATTAANQYTLDRWRVVVSGQALTFAASGNLFQMTAPAGGLEQIIEALMLEGGTYTLSWTGTATATINGTAVANGGTFTLPANASATVRFTGGTVSQPQLELGSFASTFEQRPLGLEFAMCKRYTRRYGGYMGVGQAISASSANVMIDVSEMRIAPAIESYAGLNLSSSTGPTNPATTMTLGSSSTSSLVATVSGGSGLVAGNATLFGCTNLVLNAEF